MRTAAAVRIAPVVRHAPKQPIAGRHEWPLETSRGLRATETGLEANIGSMPCVPALTSDILQRALHPGFSDALHCSKHGFDGTKLASPMGEAPASDNTEICVITHIPVLPAAQQALPEDP